MNVNDTKKRKVSFAELDEANKKTKNAPNDTRLHSGKYTLDSDEDDDDDEQGNNKEMDQNDLDGLFQLEYS
jgi:hypothetical protein